MMFNVRYVSLVVVSIVAITVFEVVGTAGPQGPIEAPCGDGCDSALFIKRVYWNDPGMENAVELYGVTNINFHPCTRIWTIAGPNSDDPSGNVVRRTCHQMANDLVAGLCPDDLPGDQPVSVPFPQSLIGGLIIRINCYEDPEHPGDPGDCVAQPPQP